MSISLKIWGPQLLVRVLRSKWWQRGSIRLLSRPTVGYAALAWVVWKLIRDPESLARANPQVAQAVVSFRAKWNQPVTQDASDRTRTVNQAMTWGVAGVAVVLLTSLTATHSLDTAARIAAACLALSIPTLTVCGFMQMIYTDPKSKPLTMRDALGLGAVMHLGHVIFCVGFAALLWSYDPTVAVVFMVGCVLALRYIRWLALRNNMPGPTPPTAG